MTLTDELRQRADRYNELSSTMIHARKGIIKKLRKSALKGQRSLYDIFDKIGYNYYLSGTDEGVLVQYMRVADGLTIEHDCGIYSIKW